MNNTSRNHTLVHNGKALSLAEWGRETGLKQETIRNRIKLGWSTADALTLPLLVKPPKLPTFIARTQIIGAQRDELFRAHAGICIVCTKPIERLDPWIDEHVVPRWKGGTNDLAN